MARPFKVSDSIKARIVGILGILAAGYLLLLGMTRLTAGATHDHIERISASLFPAAMRIREAQGAFEEVKMGYLDAVLREDVSAMSEASAHADELVAALTELRATVAGFPELANDADALLQRFASINARSQITYGKMVESRGNIGEDTLAEAGALAKEDRELAVDMKTLDGKIGVEFQQERATVELWSSRSRVTGWFMLMVGLIGCTGAWWMLQYKVLAPLENLSRRMRDIAEGDGDLTGRVEVLGRSELDEVGRWFNVFIERVETIVVEVAANARALAGASIHLAGAAREGMDRAAMQKDEATTMTYSMEEISNAALAISQSTQKAAQDARNAEQKAQAGGETIRATVATIQELLAANQTTAAKIAELGSSSDAIGRIIGVIDDIASQTSLLALNAAIESARAGEHGRGFAVVASEVRRLAERTGNATREIGETVRAMQSGTAEVVAAMQASMTQVASGVGSARSAGHVLESIIQGAEDVQKMVSQIASASTQQSQSTQSVNVTLNKIAGIMELANTGAESAVEGCAHLSALAAELNAVVGSFKVRERPSAEAGRPGRPDAAHARNKKPAIGVAKYPFRAAVLAKR